MSGDHNSHQKPSRVIDALRSAVVHRSRISLDDIDAANLLSEFELIQEGLDVVYLKGYAKGRDAMKAQCLTLCEEELVHDSYALISQYRSGQQVMAEHLADKIRSLK